MANNVTHNSELSPVFEGGQGPEWLNRGQFEHEGPWGSNNVLKEAGDVAGSTWERMNALHEYRVGRNPEDEPAVHARKLARLVDEASREWATQWDRVRPRLVSERKRVEDALKSAANLKANDKLINATLGTFQGMTPQQRNQAISDLIDEGASAGPVLAILSETPRALTGLSKEQQEAIKVRAYSKADASAYALLGQLDKALDRAERASIAAISGFSKLRQGTDRFDKKVERAKELETKVRSGFAA